jgi:hypothetical protein
VNKDAENGARVHHACNLDRSISLGWMSVIPK